MEKDYLLHLSYFSAVLSWVVTLLLAIQLVLTFMENYVYSSGIIISSTIIIAIIVILNTIIAFVEGDGDSTFILPLITMICISLALIFPAMRTNPIFLIITIIAGVVLSIINCINYAYYWDL